MDIAEWSDMRLGHSRALDGMKYGHGRIWNGSKLSMAKCGMGNTVIGQIWPEPGDRVKPLIKS